MGGREGVKTAGGGRWLAAGVLLWGGCVCACWGGAAGAGVQPASLEVIRVRELATGHPELDGSSVRVGIVELCEGQGEYAFLPNFAHAALRGTRRGEVFCYRSPQAATGGGAVSGHASLIAGLLAGCDPNGVLEGLGAFAYQGAAPGAVVDVYETNWFLYRRVLGGGGEKLGEDVLSISWGTEAEDAVTEWWQRGIDALAAREGCVVVAGGGDGSRGFGGIVKPSWGYNVISVGAARSLGAFPVSLRAVGPATPETSSCGPTTDGRCKPEVLAPGLAVGPDGRAGAGYLRSGSEVGYSSFAAPQVAGAAALLMDAARKGGLTGGDDPRVIKAVLLNGADKLVGWHKGAWGTEDDEVSPLDWRQGAGLVNAVQSWEQLTAGRLRAVERVGEGAGGEGEPNEARGWARAGWDLNWVAGEANDPNGMRVYPLAPGGEGESCTATLTWYREYEGHGVFAGRPLAWLRLELWELAPGGGLSRLLEASASEVDNVQHIWRSVAGSGWGGLAVVVRAGGEGRPGERVTYGLATALGRSNWTGDQLAGDLDVNGRVDIDDLLRFIRVWRLYRENPDQAELDRERPWVAEDLNGDGRVNSGDYHVFSQQWRERSWWCGGADGR